MLTPRGRRAQLVALRVLDTLVGVLACALLVVVLLTWFGATR